MASLRAASRHILKRSIIAPRVLARGLATPTLSHDIQATTLKNGLTVATQHSPFAQTATVGVFIDAGSRSETDANNGTAHFLEHLAFKGTAKRTQHQLELEIENMGGHLNAYTSRENTVYHAKSLKADVGKSVEILSDILQNSKLEESAIERERGVILREQEEVDRQLEEVVFDHLHATAFQKQPLGRTILGPKENILSIKRSDLQDYIANNYKADRMVLAGAGGIPHEQLVELAEKHFSGLKPSENPMTIGTPRGAKPEFIGSEIRMRDDTMPTAHIAIAVEGVSWKDPDFYAGLVASSIVGNWDRSMGNANYLGSKLSSVVYEYKLANSFMSFSTSYSDTGLWGTYMVTENVTNIDDLVHFTLREWSRLAQTVTEAEVERAKAQLKATLLMSLDGTTALAEDIGRQIVTTGRRMNPAEVERVVDAITPKDIIEFAQKRIWDQDIAISAVGQIEGLLDYQRVRADTSRNF